MAELSTPRVHPAVFFFDPAADGWRAMIRSIVRVRQSGKLTLGQCIAATLNAERYRNRRVEAVVPIMITLYSETPERYSVTEADVFLVED